MLAGTGFAHMGGDPIPIGPGSCFHLPRDHVHCIENSGPGVMQILGVFHPAESPAARVVRRGGSRGRNNVGARDVTADTPTRRARE